jgi:hypothetical protein
MATHHDWASLKARIEESLSLSKSRPGALVAVGSAVHEENGVLVLSG